MIPIIINGKYFLSNFVPGYNHHKLTMKTHTNIPDEHERALPEFNAMQTVKRRFFAMRNGDLAQQMAERGARYRINFGLNLPQISEIARDFIAGGKERIKLEKQGESFDAADFARRLRDNTSTRESMLIAPMLFPVDMLSRYEALEWGRSVPTPEVADVLCLKLLRNHADAEEIAGELIASDEELHRYTGLRLLLNLLQLGKIGADRAREMTVDCKPTPMASGVLRGIAEEIAFIKDEV